MDWYKFVSLMGKINDLSARGWTFLFLNGKVEVIYDTYHVRWFDALESFEDYIDDLYMV